MTGECFTNSGLGRHFAQSLNNEGADHDKNGTVTEKHRLLGCAHLGTVNFSAPPFPRM